MSEDILDLANRHVTYLLDEGDSESAIEISALINECTRLRSLLKEAVTALEIAEEALDNYSDVVDGAEGQPRANAAMQAMMEVQATLSKIKGAA